jgi:hypothetical protein
MNKKNNLTLISCFIGLLILTGCPGPGVKNDPVIDMHTGKTILDAQKDVSQHSKEMLTASGAIKSKAENIKTNAVFIETQIPDKSSSASESLTKIKTNSDEIISQTNVLDVGSASLTETAAYLVGATKEVGIIEGSLLDAKKDVQILIKDKKKLEEERDKAIADRDSAVHKMLTYLIIGSILGSIGFSFAFFIYGSKLGMFGGAICAITLIVSIFIQSYFQYIAIAGGIIFILLIIMLFIGLIRNKKAIKELVDTVEVAKDNMDPEEKEKVFGTATDKGIMDMIQSSSTQEFVKKVKTNLPSLWQYIKKYKSGDKELEDIS